MRQGRPGPYQVQAGIAALHALAASYEATNWADVRALYDRLHALDPSPVVLLNRAVATRFAVGPAPALAEVDALRDRLAGYRLWHAARADLLAALDRPAEALDGGRAGPGAGDEPGRAGADVAPGRRAEAAGLVDRPPSVTAIRGPSPGAPRCALIPAASGQVEAILDGLVDVVALQEHDRRR